jgi:hypothetical protein
MPAMAHVVIVYVAMVGGSLWSEEPVGPFDKIAGENGFGHISFRESEVL